MFTTTSRTAFVAFLTASGLALLAACEPGPRPIAYGEDVGDYCRMTIVDEGYGAELVTRTGKVYTFDSIECLAAFYLEGQVPRQEVHSLWVTDFQDPPALIRVEEAFFLHSRDLPSPMGMNLTAFSDVIRRDAVTNSFYGDLLDWEGVLDLVAGGGSLPHGKPGQGQAQGQGEPAGHGSGHDRNHPGGG